MAFEIIELKEQGNSRFTAVLSDGRKARVSTAMIADLSLYSGKELSCDEAEELCGAARYLACRERALRIVGSRPMSCRELYNKLVEKGEEPEDAENCVEWMLERSFLDDVKYAVMLVRHYAGRGYGLQRVKNELFRRGIAKTLWDDALAEMPEVEETVYRLLCNKLRGDNPDRAQIKKASDALFRRGYSWDEIKCAVNRFREDNPELD